MGNNFTDIATTDPVTAATLNDRLDELDAAIGPSGASITGELRMWLTNTAPTGWLLCYGQAVSRSTYSALYGVIGTTFGTGDGSTTFNLPDMRGRVPLGQDDMGGTGANRVTAAAADAVGGTGGAETHTLATTEIPSHNHKDPDEAGFTGLSYKASGGSVTWFAGGSTANQADLTAAGGGGAHNNLQPYITVNYIIYAGV